MVSLLCHLHFWTLKALSPRTGVGNDIGCHTYHDKTASSSTLGDRSSTCRKQWAEGRGITWTPRNKPERLRARLKECEELMSLHTPVCLKWRALRHCLLLLKNGVLITFTVAKHSGDIERISIDRSLVMRLPSNIDAAVIGDNSILLSFSDDHRPAILSLERIKSSGIPHPLALTQTDSGKKLEKISNVDPKLDFAHVRGLPVTGTLKQVRVNNVGDLAVFWWKKKSTHLRTTHNIILFAINSGKLQYVGGVHTEFQPVDIQFSKKYFNKLYCLERSSKSTYISSTYECSDNKLSKTIEAEITISGHVSVCERNRDETKLLLACEDGTVVLQDSGKTLTTQAYIKPISLVRWHPAGAFVCVLGSKGELQAYDLGLNPLHFLMNSEEPSTSLILSLDTHILAPTRLIKAEWGSGPREGEGHGGCYDNFIMVFESGPIVLLRLELGVLSKGCVGPVELVSEYLRLGDIEKSIQILCRLNWSSQSLEAYSVFSLILNHILRLPLTTNTIAQMEATLATFLTPEKPVPKQIHSAHKEGVFNIARRCFFLLLRNGYLEKCLGLAEQLEARDLLMDVHFRAVQLGNEGLAEEAKETAEQLPLRDQLEDPLRTALCGGDGSKPLSSFQLELLRLVANDSPVENRVLGEWKREGQDRGKQKVAKDESRAVRAEAMAFDTSTDYSSDSELTGEGSGAEETALDNFDFEHTPNAESQPDSVTTPNKQTP